MKTISVVAMATLLTVSGLVLLRITEAQSSLPNLTDEPHETAEGEFAPYVSSTLAYSEVLSTALDLVPQHVTVQAASAKLLSGQDLSVGLLGDSIEHWAEDVYWVVAVEGAGYLHGDALVLPNGEPVIRDYDSYLQSEVPAAFYIFDAESGVMLASGGFGRSAPTYLSSFYALDDQSQTEQ